jgi:hypothetical protein
VLGCARTACPASPIPELRHRGPLLTGSTDPPCSDPVSLTLARTRFGAEEVFLSGVREVDVDDPLRLHVLYPTSTTDTRDRLPVCKLLEQRGIVSVLLEGVGHGRFAVGFCWSKPIRGLPAKRSRHPTVPVYVNA